MLGLLPIALIVAGPTASGKTSLALALAESLSPQISCEIVNFDSVQLYRDFDLGTAKPSAEDLARARHHLIGVADARAPWTAGEYARQARPVVEAILQRERLPILVGGTGFYLRALLEGLSAAPGSDAALRQKLRRRTPEQLHRLLLRLDPEAGKRIAVRDASKAIRALEVRLLSGRPMGEVWSDAPPQPWRELQTLRLGLAPERAALYERINRRASHMFAGGIQEETRRLLAQYPAELRIWTSHGYKQACDIVLRGANTAAALAEAAQEQRRYAKRQWTWFRADRAMHWLAGFGDDAAVQAEALALARAAIHKDC
ncbi:MAG: tRNA (adenosine(37)-N6)-dimethylallyltransferase MiaA [Acidobacteria bacterium]|nr:MAG: tRNA (adenosine(37)-N6)-dimethylallyltransferase MiaA [Acidobacteriota bacterium]